jgi:hypothetical protein
VTTVSTTADDANSILITHFRSKMDMRQVYERQDAGTIDCFSYNV